MTYKILIKGSNGAYQFAQVLNEAKNALEDFESTEVDAVKEELLKLLDTYNKDSLHVMAEVKDAITYDIKIDGE